ncbi:hypothetical protein N0V86_005239 [Didymella sp. IMI 355093]|nr:hypothetical protein N0V86_005239 [Didymella sp. IMI 355093]
MAPTGLLSPVSSKEFIPSLSPRQMQPHDDFTVCQSGDTIIDTDLKIPHKQWRLQSAVLARHSSWFRQSIQEQQAASDRWKDKLTYLVTEIEAQVRLIPQGPTLDVPTTFRASEGEQPGTLGIKVEDGVEGAAHEAIVNIYDQISKAFDGFPPHVSNTDIMTATAEAKQLSKVAQGLGCVHLTSSHIGNALLQHRQSLYKAILADPPQYLLLAITLENDSIYTESLIHVIGLITRKSAELDKEVLEVERKLLLLTILTTRGVPFSSEIPSQFDTWFVIQLFRDTIASVLREHDKFKPSLRRGYLFRKIKQEGSAYMVYEDVRRMLRSVMPSAVEELDENLNILKTHASEIVEDLARNELSLDVEENKVGWLTCVKIGQKDIPWRKSGEGGV